MSPTTIKFGLPSQPIATHIHSIFVTPTRFRTAVREFSTHEVEANYSRRQTSGIKIIEQ